MRIFHPHFTSGYPSFDQSFTRISTITSLVVHPDHQSAAQTSVNHRPFSDL